ncbi:hypothetical protein [Pedobacter sp. BS3]|uniref:hypothetical protein n=1 Tax=Pedobacter sp. BS3 TaxID=2567937 RepID=UPI0011F08A00|nr:hypothetical protein [Pedobacter sp. BS3]
MQIRFFILLGTGLGIVAGIMAYLIAYNELQHHFKGRRVFTESVKSAVVAFIFFFVLTIAIYYAIYKSNL